MRWSPVDPLGYASRVNKSGQSRLPGWGETRMAPQHASRALRVSRASREKFRATLVEDENLDRHVEQLKSFKGGDLSRHP